MAALLMGGMTLSSCSEAFLNEDRNPNYLFPSVFWKNESDIMKGLTSVYAALQPNSDFAVPYERYIVLDNYRSDECDFRADVGGWMSMAMFTYESTSSVPGSEWWHLYKGINRANQCIDNIPNVPGGESIDALKKQAMAEARFLRAYYYYRLSINFGEKVPMYFHQIEGTEKEFYPDQAKPGELVEFIENELKEVQSDLPEKYSANDGGRATCYAAAAILGKFYMFRHELGKAEKEFEKLIGKFELMENFGDNFDGLHKNNKESVFEVQFSGNMESDQAEYNVISLHLAPFNAFDGGYEEAYPSDWLFEVMKTDKTTEGKYSDRLLKTIIFDDPDCHTAYYADGYSFKDYHSAGEIFWNKFVTWDPSLSSDWYISAFNIPIVRYADVLLLYAECLNDRGATKDAIGYINQVRDRVHVPALPESMSKEAVLKHLQDVERPCELALEGARWYDLVRWNIVEKSLKEHGKPFMENYMDSKHKLLPIPHSEFLLNPDWEQNPNYTK